MLTNRAFVTGMSTSPFGGAGAAFVPTWVGPMLAGITTMPTFSAGSLTARANRDYIDLFHYARLMAKRSPYQTDVARDPGTLLGVERNSAYLISSGSVHGGEVGGPAPPSAFADPPSVGGQLMLGARKPPELGPDTYAFDLSHAFHMSRAVERCSVSTAAPVARVVERLRIGNAAMQPVERDTACQACAEYVAPYLWSTENLQRPPLCSYMPGYPSQISLFPLLTGGWSAYPAAWGAHVVAWESPLKYVNGDPLADSEELAKMMCCGTLDTRGGTGNFRMVGSFTYGPPGVEIGLFLRSATAAPFRADLTVPVSGDPDGAPVFEWDSVAQETKLNGISHTDRYAIKYNANNDTALYTMSDTGPAGKQSYFFSNPSYALPATGTYVLTPATATGAPVRCSFSSSCEGGGIPGCTPINDGSAPAGSVRLELSQAKPEYWHIDWIVGCVNVASGATIPPVPPPP
jgi:hypothetical protein